MLLGPVRTHLTTWAGNTDCIAKINSRGEMGYQLATATTVLRSDVIGGSSNVITIMVLNTLN